MAMEDLPSDIIVTYRAEGAANVVFSLSGPGLEDKLLRLPKITGSMIPYHDIHEYWEGTIRPLFDEDHLVQQCLVRLPAKLGSLPFIDGINAMLDADSARPTRWVGRPIAPVTVGMLVEDMSPASPQLLCCETKPKWLAQSPSAPPGSLRCRNCARKLWAKSQDSSADIDTLCPLHFINALESHCGGNWNAPNTEEVPLEVRDLSVARLVHALSYDCIASQYAESLSKDDRVDHWLRTNTLIPLLRKAQLDADIVGPLRAEENPSGLALAMTLRDCSLFFIIPADPSKPLIAKLGDLDRKRFDKKLKYWRETEQALIDGSYYDERNAAYDDCTDCGLRPMPERLKKPRSWKF